MKGYHFLRYDEDGKEKTFFRKNNKVTYTGKRPPQGVLLDPSSIIVINEGLDSEYREAIVVQYSECPFCVVPCNNEHCAYKE